MKKTFMLAVALVFAVTSLVTVANAKKVTRQSLHFEIAPRPDAPLPPDLVGQLGDLRSAAATDTFVLLDEDFDGGNGAIPAGWSTVDVTDQIDAFFHVASGPGELDGGTFGNLNPISGANSMWCGVAASTAVPYCGYSGLPGYGNGWDQVLTSATLGGDSLTISYDVFWDSEGGYDGTTAEYSFNGGATWLQFPVTDTLSARAGLYDNTGIPGGITETFSAGAGGSGNGTVTVRYRFVADGAWSDEDGLWPTDGAIMFDNITLTRYTSGSQVGTDTEDFEAATEGDNTAGIWSGIKAPAYGDFAALYPGVTVEQEDPCLFNPLFLWAYFDSPVNTAYNCHVPNPLPGQGAMPYGTPEDIYMSNEVWSPAVTNVGSGVEYRLLFDSYRDLPLSNLQFYVFHIRGWTDPDGAGPQPLCPGTWRDFNFVYYGGQKDWLRALYNVGSIVDGSSDAIQIAMGAVDMCPVWCNVFGTGACHSHAPLHDNVRLERVAVFGPQYTVQKFQNFQDNFAGDGTLTGTARFDAGIDILPSSSPGILPGDSCAITVNPVGASGGSPAVWMYARVQNSNKTAPSALDMEAPEQRNGGDRWPYVGDWTDANSNVWHCFQMDSAITPAGGITPDRYCIDLNDDLFVPGDTIHYFFAADADGTTNNGNENYWHRILDGQGFPNITPDREVAAASPCEATILPAGGFNRGGDILYVDDADDRGGPPGLFFDSAFDILGIGDLVDRYDVLGPASLVGNSLASRVTNNNTQIINIYRKIIWNSGNLSSGLIGDGTGNPEKSDDFGLLEHWLRTSLKGPGLYISGDDVAAEWSTLAGAGAVLMRSTQMPYTLLDGDHVNFGEAMSPTLTAENPSNFTHLGVPDQLIAYGGCALINDFDVMDVASGAGVTSVEEFSYPNAQLGGNPGSAVLSSTFMNSASTDATIFLSGFSYHYIRDAAFRFPPARVEHLNDILQAMGNDTPDPTSVPKGGPQFTNALHNAYPNPFNPTTTIKYSIKESAHVSLKVYNAAGQLVKTLVDEVQVPDQIQPVAWDGANNSGQTVSSGVYFYKLVTKNFQQTKKMVLLK